MGIVMAFDFFLVLYSIVSLLLQFALSTSIYVLAVVTSSHLASLNINIQSFLLLPRNVSISQLLQPQSHKPPLTTPPAPTTPP